MRDLLAFVPFAIILIIPMTPVGHVLVFGFIQARPACLPCLLPAMVRQACCCRLFQAGRRVSPTTLPGTGVPPHLTSLLLSLSSLLAAVLPGLLPLSVHEPQAGADDEVSAGAS